MVFINREHGILFLHPSKTCGTSVKNTLESVYQNDNNISVIELAKHLWNGQIMTRLFYHLNADDVKRKFPDANRSCYTFVAVRNPYDRAYSLYAYSVDKVNTYGIKVFWFLLVTFVLLIMLTFIAPPMISFFAWFVVFLFIIAIMYRGNWVSFTSYTTKSFNESTKYIPELVKTHNSIFGTQAQHCDDLRIDKVVYEDRFEKDFKEVLEQINLNDVEIKTSNTGASGKGEITKGQIVDGVQYRYLDKFDSNSIRIINEVYREDFERFDFKMLDPITKTHLNN